MKAVILAGGLGTRLREETEYRPKPMVEIGGRPILWHIMKGFAACGVTDFVVCVGYRGEVIKDYFLNYEARNSDFTVRLGTSSSVSSFGEHSEGGWSVTVADTGATTMTGGRVKRVENHLGDRFMVTYGDGLSDVDMASVLAFHRSHGRLATVTTVRAPNRFGMMEIGEDGAVKKFREKPISDEFVNAGFFVFEREVLDFIGLNSVLEKEPLQQLTEVNQLMAYRHHGFWQPMDTYREFLMLNEMWDSGEAPWKTW
jgi:glucose-1-phosphate cytidylyltransferase